jgi:catechol 2,3-dioxygenase-like lactoylglutathione lyase family enzyme
VISGLDHAVLLCADITAGRARYSALLGNLPVREQLAEGSAYFQLANTALELIAPVADAETAPRLREILSREGEGLKSLAFSTADIASAHHTAARRGLRPQEIIAAGNEAQRWRRFRCDDRETAQVKTFIIARETPFACTPPSPGGVTRLDHIVIDTPNPDRALAHYGARLGLTLALDRTSPEWRTRFLFFRTGEVTGEVADEVVGKVAGGLTFEVVHRLDGAADPAGPDRIWGLTWATNDLVQAHARLTAAGFTLSDRRAGRKPGSTVFTVRDGTLGVPTLFIAHAAR